MAIHPSPDRLPDHRWDAQVTSLTAAVLRFGGWVVRSSAGVSARAVGGHIGGFFQPTIPSIESVPVDVLAQARTMASDSGFPQFIWSQPTSPLSVDCWQEGLSPAPSLAGMALELSGNERSTDGELVVDVAGAKRFRQVHATQFTASADPRGAVAHFGRDEVVLADDVRAVVFGDGGPLSAGLVVFSGEIAGIYFLATIDAARGRGFARQVMGRLIAEAAIAGCHTVVLQATRMGRPLYASMGFEDHGLVEKWVVAPQA